MDKNVNRNFPKEDIQMANKHMKRCPTSLIIKKMQIKATMRRHFTITEMIIMEKTISVAEVMKKLGPSCIVDWDVKGCSDFGK